MSPIDDAEILARYGLESFAAMKFGAGDESAADFGERSRIGQHSELGPGDTQDMSMTQQTRLAHGRKGSSSSRRRRQTRGNDNGEYDYGYDDDERDDDDDEYGSGQYLDSMSSGGASAHNLAISDRDPLHIHQSVVAVLESKGDRHSLSDMAYRAKFSVSNRNFSPPTFMQVIHSDTSYADLVQGARLLRESVSQGTEALKILVHNNFDRFVDARNKIDLLYDEMKSRSLNEEAEYGTRAFSQALQGTTHKADEIYNPIIDRRARVEKVRSTLSVVERYKFYFNLPSSLIEYTRKSRFDIAVREYKKGRQLLQTVTVGHAGPGDEAAVDDSQTTALSKIFQYVWKEAQESVVELRNALFRHLAQSWRPYSEQENVIRYLLEIDPGDKDPVAYYLERQHAWIVEQMQDIYQNHQQKAVQASHHSQQVERRRTFGSGAGRELQPDAERRADELVRALGIESFTDFPAFSHGRDSEYHLWRQIYNALRTLSQTLVRCLPDFWKLSQAYMEEMYQKPAAKGVGRRRRPGLNLDRVSKCHSLLEEIIEKYSQYVLRLTGILSEGENVVNPECMGESQIQSTVQRLPQTHALLAGHFMTATMELVVNTANDIEAIDMAQEPAIILANLISQLKAGLVLFLCEMWDHDAQYMSLHEDWCLHHGTSYWPPFYIARRDRQNVEGSPATVADIVANTELLPLFLRTAQTISGQLSTIHSAALQPGKSTRTMMQGQTPHFNATFDEGQRQQSERSHELHDMAISHVKHTFFGSLYAFLDTLHLLAFGTHPQADAQDEAKLPAGDNRVAGSGALQQYSGLPPARSSAQRRFSFSLPVKSATRDAWSVSRRHSVAEASRQEQSKLSGRHTTRSFFVLATLCNLTAFRLFVVPDLLHSKAVRYVFKLNVADELPRLEKMLRRLDDMIFSCYIRDKTRELGSIVHRGVLMGGFSWQTPETPKDTQPYVSEALLYLVFTHAEIMDLIAEAGAGAEHHMVKQQPLTKRVFQVLTANLAQDLLESMRAIDSFSVGGMLQCVLESLVISQTLQAYLTAPATECLRLLHSYVRASFERTQDKAAKMATQQGRPSPRPAAGDLREVNGVVLAEEHWDTVQKLLRDCTRRTQIQFRCFQPPSPNTQ
ncbi:Exocyst complex component S5 [Coemansia thaxteri]|uniref:Exocyst complex component SEC5 n=1 Tax=Coemansia thaxteri TaxID=2663907 RepID=A0A9W8BFW2_9FUNG|nr:Exocyst complex component S5 [Coemansia thaxteri]